MKLNASLEKIISGIDYEARERVFIDTYFQSGITFNQLVINFDFAGREDVGKFEQILKKLNRKKSVYVFYKNYNRFGACIGIVEQKDAAELEFYHSWVARCSLNFNEVRHEYIMEGMDENLMLEKLDALHAENCRKFVAELENRRAETEKIIYIRKSA